MSTNLNPPATCPNCAQPLPASAPAGLCPACLLAQGLDTDPGGKPGRFQPPPVEEIARLFPQLEILGLLGAGGMGAVYKARQPALDRFVALKVLPPQDQAGADSTERFNREARALARLSHPNIVAVHEFGFARAGELETPNLKPETPTPAFPYFIMEFVDGANLRQLGRAARLSPREALQIIPQICDALQYAHDEGVVHRDIKPENVLVDRKGRVKIADFGLAKIFGPDGDTLRLTAEGQVMGTPHYMAPEQVERPLAVDHRADIYSLGVVFYELLTGDLPLGKFPPPSRKVSVDVRLDDVVLRALENDPARRYQQVSEVKSQVADITGSAATQPTPGSSRREEAQTPAAPPLPANLIIVACLLLFHGAEALWRALNIANLEAVSFNTSLLALPVGIGLLRLRSIARLAALLLLVVVSCIHLYVIGLLWFAPEVVKQGATLNGIPFDPGAALPLTALIMLGHVAVAGWAGWTLTRPAVRTLFCERTVTRPWLEWAVLAGTLALTALAPRWHAADADIRAGSWGVFAAVVGFGIWRWRSQVSSSSRREEAQTSPTSTGTTQRRLLHWAGFPVVTEFGNEREVNWNGTLSALAAAFFCLFLGFVAVRFVTGRANNPGTLPVCAAMAVLTVMAGVRRTLNQPWESELPRTAGGTVVLSGNRRPLHGRFALLAIPLFVVAWSLFVIHWLQPKLRHQTGGPLIVARVDPATGILRANVPGRGVIELLGVAETNAAPNQWWRPDGRVATNTNYELHNLVESSRDSGHFRVFVFRAHDLPEGADGPFLASAEPGAMMSSGGTVFSHGKPLASGRPMVLALREPRRFTAIRVGLAIEARRAVFSYDPATRRTQHFSQPGDPRWGVSLHGATDTPDGSQVTSIMPRVSTDWQVQLIAVDQAGKERTHRMASGAGTPSGGDQLWTYNFPGLPLKDVKEFRVVVRRVQQFEFPDVVLEPKGKLPEAQPLRFSPAQEITLNELLDLDTGRTNSFPPGLAEDSLRQSDEMRRWAAERDHDVAAGIGSLLVLHTEFAQVGDEDWDRLTPPQVIDSVYRARFAPAALRPNATSRTFSYETRDGGFGLLQIVGFGEGGFGAVIRIKRIER
jgi:serine/threonine protein kinase